jgi:alkaline phosphatase D
VRWNERDWACATWLRTVLARVLFYLIVLAVTAGCAAMWPLQRLAAPANGRSAPVDLIAFGSCARQSAPQPIWNAVLRNSPDLFVFLGDNIYADTTDPHELRAQYGVLDAQPGFRRLRATTPVIATWDDHDYGQNDAGAENPIKDASKEIFLDFWGEPAASNRRNQEGGIYADYAMGPEGRRVQILLLDTRWDRTPLARIPDVDYQRKKADGSGPYAPDDDLAARLLGEAQWQWLEQALRAPADLRLIATSIPFLQEGTGWETWENFPHEKQRMLALVEGREESGILFITGDTHRAQFSRVELDSTRVLWEVDSSGLTEEAALVAPDRSRYGDFYVGDNFGLIRIDWMAADPVVHFEIRDDADRVVLEQEVRLSELSP